MADIFRTALKRREREAGLEGEPPAQEAREQAPGFSFSKGRPAADPAAEAAKKAALLRLLRERQ